MYGLIFPCRAGAGLRGELVNRQSLFAFVCSFAHGSLTIKFARAVSQKELEKVLHAGEGHFNPDDLKKMKAAFEVIGDFEDLRRLKQVLADFAKSKPQIGCVVYSRGGVLMLSDVEAAESPQVDVEDQRTDEGDALEVQPLRYAISSYGADYPQPACKRATNSARSR